MLVHLRTGPTGLRHFLSKAWVQGYELKECSCDTGPETPMHILLHCPHEDERRVVLREALWGQLDLSRLLAPLASKWMIRKDPIIQAGRGTSLLHRQFVSQPEICAAAIRALASPSQPQPARNFYSCAKSPKSPIGAWS